MALISVIKDRLDPAEEIIEVNCELSNHSPRSACGRLTSQIKVVRSKSSWQQIIAVSLKCTEYGELKYIRGLVSSR